MLFRTRDLLVGQRTQLVNALRGHLAEHGIIVSQGVTNIARIEERLGCDPLPDLVRDLARLYLDQIAQIGAEIGGLDKRITAAAKENDTARRLQTMPGIGPVCAMAIAAFAPDMREFRRGRDFSAWLGLVPRQYSTGGKQRLGRTSKNGSARHPATSYCRGNVRRTLETLRSARACRDRQAPLLWRRDEGNRQCRPPDNGALVEQSCREFTPTIPTTRSLIGSPEFAGNKKSTEPKDLSFVPLPPGLHIHREIR